MSSFSDEDAAALYDAMTPASHPADVFFHEILMSADAALDVGCGTGIMLHRAREAGHTGRLVGVDPDVAALERARRRSDIEWLVGRAHEMGFRGEFDVAIMSSHAFQCLVRDGELRDSLAAIRAALVDGGRFAFDTRHPHARAWEEWRPENGRAVDFGGRRVHVWHDVESVDAGVVTLTETVAGDDGEVVRVDRGRLRFLDIERLNAFVTNAGLSVDAQGGDWDGSPVRPASEEIITIARRA
jgi:SAM-dependent methyltransferase